MNGMPGFSILHLDDEQKVVVLRDLDAGGPSLTNGMEQVAVMLARDLGLDIAQYHLLYRDSEGRWDIATFTPEPTPRVFKVHFHPGGLTRKEGEAQLAKLRREKDLLGRLGVPGLPGR